MADWLNELEESLRNVKGRASQSNNQNKNEGQNMDKLNQNTLALFGMVVLLAIGIFACWKIKTDMVAQQGWAQNQNVQSNVGAQQQIIPWQSQTPQSTDQKVEILKKQYENLDTAAQKIWERTKWNSDRIALLGTLNNHNLLVIQQGYPKTELIFLNSDWTINRLPNRILLDANDQEFLKRFLKPSVMTTANK